MRGKLIAAILALYSASAFGQTAAEIEARYGKPVGKAHSVSEHVWLEAEYGADGQVCRMRVYPKGIQPNSNREFITFPYDEVKNVLNQLVPLNTRGMKQGAFGFFSSLGGGVAWTTYPYEKVTFTFYFLFRIDQEVSREPKPVRIPALEFPSDRELKDMLPSEDDFSPIKGLKGDLFKIEWKDRKCAG